MRKLYLFLLLLLIASSVGCTTRIGPGMVGIEVDQSGSQRGVQDITLKTGRVWFNPYSTSIIEYPTYMQSRVWSASVTEGQPVDESITFTTKDSMIVSADFNVSYTLVEKLVPSFYIQFRTDDIVAFSDGFMHNQARDCINAVAGTYDIEQIMGDNAQFITASRKCLQDALTPYGVQIAQFGLIGAPRPPENVKRSINMKVQATQLALQKQNEVAQATADAKSRVAAAEGDASAQIARAKGEAEANRIKSSSIDDRLIRWYQLTNEHDMIWRWNGQTPTVQSGAAAGLLLQLPNK